LPFELTYTTEAQNQFNALAQSRAQEKRFKAVKKSLRFLANDPTHPGLNTHKFDSLKGPDGTEVFEAYAENNTPGAYRIFWCYHPPKSNTITILLITPHP
jgi:hypothetical protein